MALEITRRTYESEHTGSTMHIVDVVKAGRRCNKLGGYFMTEAEADAHVESLHEREAEMAERRKARAAERSGDGHPFKVGDAISYSWGYEQTNVDFFEVVRVSAKSVWLRPIGGESLDPTGPFSDRVRPVKGTYYGDPIRKPVMAYTHGGTKSYYLSFPHGSGSIVKDGSSLHRSWGH